MPSRNSLILLCLSATLTACVPMSSYRALQGQNAALEKQAGENAGLAQDKAALSDRSTSLAQQNLHLQRERSNLMQEAQERDDFYESVMTDLRREVGAGRLKINRYKDMITLDVADDILFDSAKADLKEVGRGVLLQVAKAVSKGDKTIRVVGHTDDQVMAPGAGFASNWELSTARATSVVRFLQEHGMVDPTRLLAAGRGQWMPVATNATAEGRQRNRRIEITLVNKGLLDTPTEAVKP